MELKGLIKWLDFMARYIQMGVNEESSHVEILIDSYDLECMKKILNILKEKES